MTVSDELATEKAESAKKKSAGKGVSIRFIGAVAIIAAILLAFSAFATAGYISDAYNAAKTSENRYIECSNAVDELQDASDYLTAQARLFVTSGRWECLDAYLDEIDTVDRRGHAVQTLETNLSDNEEATELLNKALASSDELAELELTAMKLAADHYGIDNLPDQVANAKLTEAEKTMSSDKKLEHATHLVFSGEYSAAKESIRNSVSASSLALLADLDAETQQSNTLMQNLLFGLRISVALLLCVVLLLVLVLLIYVLKPLDRDIKRIERNEPLEESGSYELHYLANAYNAVYEDNVQRIEHLRAISERDPLTGISNRNGYNNFLAKHTRNVVLLLIDIDNFKDFNTVYGRDTGDAILAKLGRALSTAFRSTDFPCRIESDLFAVIMTNMTTDLYNAVSSKMQLVNSILADDSDDLPVITLSVGAAFSTEGMDDRDIYQAARSALKQAQEKGNSLAFYGENNN